MQQQAPKSTKMTEILAANWQQKIILDIRDRITERWEPTGFPWLDFDFS